MSPQDTKYIDHTQRRRYPPFAALILTAAVLCFHLIRQLNFSIENKQVKIKILMLLS